MPGKLVVFDRRTFIGSIAGGLLATPFAVDAQPAGRLLRVIGWLDEAWAPAGPSSSLDAFRRRLEQLGWTEGRQVAIVVRAAGQRREDLSKLAAELVALEVDVMVTPGTPASRAASKMTARIPIVMAGTDNPVRDGLVASLARPGGNVTGLTNNPGPAFYQKMVQLLKEAAPRVSKVAVLADPGSEANIKEIRAAASALGLAIVAALAPTPDDVPRALAAALQAGADGLFVFPSSINSSRADLIADFARANRLPTISGDVWFIRAGGLLSYWTDWTDLKRRSAGYVDKILRGANPADLPVEQPTEFELLINYGTAEAIGITIAPWLRQLAHPVPVR